MDYVIFILRNLFIIIGGVLLKVYIAEKPKMAEEIAKYLPGPLVRKDGYIETGGGIVTWLVGHIMRLAEPKEYDPKYEKWNLADLPIIPEDWKLFVSDRYKKQFDVVKKLVKSATEIVHAGDPDREGQLLVDEVLEFLDNKKPVQRILLNALNETRIKKALGDLRSNHDFQGLTMAAKARQRADWLTGMNASRAYTIAAYQAGHKLTFPVGRVKSPTLALVVRREREIMNFKPKDYYGFKAEFQHENGTFTAVWKARDTQKGLDTEGRLVDRSVAGELKKKFENASDKAVITSFETKENTTPQPLPFSLSALQVAAGKKFGHSPKEVLDTAQSLYEKKLTTYPRSDCDYLPESQFDDAVTILKNLSGISAVSMWAKANPKIKSRAWNDSKITAHHAIIPTEVICDFDKLSEMEQNIYFLIAQSFIAQFYPVHVYDQTSIFVSYADEDFRASGKVIKVVGWRDVYSSDGEEKEDKSEEDVGLLPIMKQMDTADFVSLKSLKKTTKPPERFSSSTLVEAMKQIHNFVKNDDLKKQLKNVLGIGTVATRAGIIDDLVNRKFLIVDKKKVIPADSAYILIDALPDELTYPDTTAIWEDKLKLVEEGTVGLDEFLTEQSDFVRSICQADCSKNIAPNRDVQTCPKCKTGMLQKITGKNGDFWGCSRFREGCKTTFQDRKGKPDIIGSKLKGSGSKK